MAILKNKSLAGKSLITAYGKILFTEDGTAEVENSVADKLATLNGFSIEDEDEDDVIDSDKDEDSNTEEPEDEDDQNEENDEDSDEDNNTDEPEDEDTNESKEEDNITREELEEMTVKQLEKFAKENGIDLTGVTKKAEIISVILGEE